VGPGEDEDGPGGSGPADRPAEPAPGGDGADPVEPAADRRPSDRHPLGRHTAEFSLDRVLGGNGSTSNGGASNGGSTNGGSSKGGSADPAGATPWTAPAWEPTAVPAAGSPAEQSAAVPGPAVSALSGASPLPATPVPVPAPAPTPLPPPAGAAETPLRPPRGRGAAAPRRTHRWGLGAYLVVEAVFLLSSLGISALVDALGATGAGGLALALAVPTVLAAATALLLTRLRGGGPRADLRLLWSWRDVGLGVAFGVGGLAITIPASVLFVAIAGEGATSAVGEVFGGMTAPPALAVLIFLIVVLLAPLCEEIVYRGLLWGGVEKLAGPRVAFAVSTLLFALAHFEFARTPLLLVVALPIAAARYYTGRLIAGVIAHQINNLLPGLVLMLGLLGALPMG
jgi:membrane protease YdiL (CAAX protease family)